MDILEAIDTRRSIRKYTDMPVSEEVVIKLLRAGMQAPSAADARPWHFVVVDDRKLLRLLASRMPGCEMLEEAVLGLLVCADPALEKIPGFWAQDCAVATEHILLAAHALGLGGCWIGLYPVEERTKVVSVEINIPEGIIPFALCSLGVPNESLPPEDRYEESKLHKNRWGQGIKTNDR